MHSQTTFFVEATHIAVQSILTHKLRTVLTLLGIVIGVASVMLVGAGIEGLETYVEESIARTLGSNSFIISKYSRFGHVSREEFEEMARRNRDVELADINFLRANCPDCEVLAGEIRSRRDVYFNGEEVSGTAVSGVTANRILFGNQEVIEGRYFTDEEVRRSRSVCVIGAEIQEKLFPGRDPIGKTVKVLNQPLRVVGVLEPLGSTFGISLDNELHMPITTFQKLFGRRNSISIRGRAATEEKFEAALSQVQSAMRVRHKLRPFEDDDFGLDTTEDINSMVEQFTESIAIVIVPITLISLLVGGIVVMNIMLVSVTERTFEIGLRKSLGARQRDILNQFLIEAFLLASLGGTLGLTLATGVARLVEATTPMTMTISAGYVFLAIGVSGGIGIIFGIYPAFRASQLDPIEALRQER